MKAFESCVTKAEYEGERPIAQVRVVRKMDNTIHRINRYSSDSVVCFVHTHPLIWIAIWPVYSVVQPSNNCSQEIPCH